MSTPKNNDKVLQKAVVKTRKGMFSRIGHALKREIKPDEAFFDNLEEALIQADTGVDTALLLVDNLKGRVKTEKAQSIEEVFGLLVEEIAGLLELPTIEHRSTQKPHVVLVTGVNGVGKTTSIARMANHLQEKGQRLMLVAADTYRAAATEQLQAWGTRLNIPVLTSTQSDDAAALAHDGYTSAVARGIDTLLIDTAGRLHTQPHLMQQLQKIHRILTKLSGGSDFSVLQVIDATIGQNSVSQIEHFHKIAPITGLIVTKLDGTAKGGVMLALARKFNIPIRFLGFGEDVNDFAEFNPDAFARALLSDVSAPNH